MSAWQLLFGFLLAPLLLNILNCLFHNGKQVGFAVLALLLPAPLFFWGMHCSMLCVGPCTAHTMVLALDLIASSCIFGVVLLCTISTLLFSVALRSDVAVFVATEALFEPA